MEVPMYPKSTLICPYLKGSSDGATCRIVHVLVRNISNADIQLCMGRHYEACALYISSLQKAAIRAIRLINPCEALEPDL